MRTGIELEHVDLQQLNEMRKVMRDDSIFDNLRDIKHMAMMVGWLEQSFPHARSWDFTASDIDVVKHSGGENNVRQIYLKHDTYVGYLHLTVHTPSIDWWDILETPVVSRIFPQAEVGKSIDKETETCSIYGPVDALGPHTTGFIRKFTSQALTAFNNPLLLVE